MVSQGNTDFLAEVQAPFYGVRQRTVNKVDALGKRPTHWEVVV